MPVSRARRFSKLNFDNIVETTDLQNLGYLTSSSATIASLSNTNISSLSSGDILQYDGSNWINKSPVILKLNCIDNANINDTTTWTSRGIFDTTPVINLGGFSVPNTSSITIPESGTYRCSFNFYIVEPGTDIRMNPGARWNINGTNQSEIAGSSYIRAGSGHQTSSLHLTSVFELSSGDSLAVYWAQLGAPGTNTKLQGSNSGVNVEKIN